MLAVEDVCFDICEKCTNYLFFRSTCRRVCRTLILVVLASKIETLLARSVVCHAECKHRRFQRSQPHTYTGKTKTIITTILHVAIALAVVGRVLTVANFKALQYTPHSNVLNRQRPAYHRWSGTITWRKRLWPTRGGP